MLPFLKVKRPGASLSTVYRKSDTEDESSNNDAGLDAVADDLLKGIHSHDKSAVVAALRAAFTILDSEPHEEGQE
jgi:hypothetical protein